jgi:hypothetical protein
MIRDAVLHLGNDQPLLVDLVERPVASDAVLVCTNVRTMSGTRPIWIDQSASLFFFPFTVIRFLEIHPGSEEESGHPPVATPAAAGPTRAATAAGAPEPDLEIDQDLLRRVRDV